MAQTSQRAGRAGARTDGRGKAAAPPPRVPPEGEERMCSVGFCPIGVALGMLQGAAPEATAHLVKAAQELLLAVRAVIDERVAGGRPAEHLERIEIS